MDASLDFGCITLEWSSYLYFSLLSEISKTRCVCERAQQRCLAITYKQNIFHPMSPPGLTEFIFELLVVPRGDTENEREEHLICQTHSSLCIKRAKS